MIREYRNLKALKRAGRGHKLGGAAGTQPGELAVICPACPQPGINMLLEPKPVMTGIDRYVKLDATYTIRNEKQRSTGS